MSWSHSSKIGLLAVSVVLLIAAVGVASAVSVTTEQAPEEAEVGEDVTVNVELQDVFEEESSWEINGQTELQDAEWTIELYHDGERVDTRESSGEQPEPVYLEDGITETDRAVVTVEGSAPELSNASYDDPATFLGGEVAQVPSEGDSEVLSQQRVRLYSEDSRDARSSLEGANETIESAAAGGAGVSSAESTFQDAVAAYDDGEFADAISLAEDAESQAQDGSSGDGEDGSSDGSGDGSTDDGTDGTSDGGSSDDGGDSSGSDASGSDSSNDDGTADGGSANDETAGDGSADSDAETTESDGDSDDSDGDGGGLLGIVLYGLLGLLILGAVGGGIYWYQQRQQGPNRDPLG